jgi:hypothetical protein
VGSRLALHFQASIPRPRERRCVATDARKVCLRSVVESSPAARAFAVEPSNQRRGRRRLRQRHDLVLEDHVWLLCLNARRRGLDDRMSSAVVGGRRHLPCSRAKQWCQCRRTDMLRLAFDRPHKAILPGTRPARETSHQTHPPHAAVRVRHSRRLPAVVGGGRVEPRRGRRDAVSAHGVRLSRSSPARSEYA